MTKRNYLTGEPAPDSFKILCPWCSAPYTAKMEGELDYSSGGCPSCGYGSGAKAEITIHCENCKRVVYKKEYTTGDY